MLEEKNTRFCSNCKAGIDMKAKICPKCGVEQLLISEKVSSWWYVFAIFLGIVGGIIAWVVNKDRNPKKAIRFLIVGLVLPAIYIISILASIVLVSLGEVREKAKDAKDAKIMGDITLIRAAAEMVYFNEGDNYSMVSCTYLQIASICQDIKTQSGEEPTVHSTQKEYCVYVKLLSGDYGCTDSSYSIGAEKTSTYPGGRGYCDGRTFICP